MRDYLKILKKHWGYKTFLPMQEAAIRCIQAKKDSLVVLSTGGGKSICYQAPIMTMPGMAVVVSPLISLMKDQVDALKNCGIPAVCINSSLGDREARRAYAMLHGDEIKLLYVAPERLVMPSFLEILEKRNIRYWSIDEAHCISAWGHDFRPEYRKLSILKERFPDASVHAFTATATPTVREDIARQLHLDDAEMVVGSFDRPNLFYRAERRQGKSGAFGQICEVIDKHRGQSGIIYSITRKSTETLASKLRDHGYKALAYHAGLDPEDRHKAQEAFLKEEVEVVVATVAFGMGIDKASVRYVIHSGMPKSIEAYQQESGRAGRDGLDAECLILHNYGDYSKWEDIITKSSEEKGGDERILEVHLEKLSEMYGYCQTSGCRRSHLLLYFGEEREEEKCSGCDNCGRSHMDEKEALLIGQKILSCVARLRESFGVYYTVDVLLGSRSKKVLDNGHDALSTYALMKDNTREQVREWIDELIAQGFMTPGEHRELRITKKGWSLIRGNTKPRFRHMEKLQAPMAVREKSRSRQDGELLGLDPELFEVLRRLRLSEARKLQVAPYVIFTDASLRDMARKKPTTMDEFLDIHGVGQVKQARWGQLFLQCIRDYGEPQSVKN
ncbi:MAG: DNA helicase RecQ [Candidatus Sumerlaeia bacterium]